MFKYLLKVSLESAYRLEKTWIQGVERSGGNTERTEACLGSDENKELMLQDVMTLVCVEAGIGVDGCRCGWVRVQVVGEQGLGEVVRAWSL